MEEETEVWKDIKGYEGLYQVSNLGRVKSLNYRRTGKEGLLKPSKQKNGYLIVVLHKDGKGQCILLHQLVALAFIPNDNPIEKTEINHLDENKENNHVDNLERCTHKYNCNYGTKLQRQSEKMKGKMLGENNPFYGKKHAEETKQKMSDSKKGKPNYKQRVPILQYTLDSEFIKEWESIKQASEELNLQHSNICMCCKGKRNKCGGFIWRYKETTI